MMTAMTPQVLPSYPESHGEVLPFSLVSIQNQQ